MDPSRCSRIVAVLREPVFSPGMVEHDAAILRGVAAELGRRAISCPVLLVSETARLAAAPELILSMAEGDDSLAALERLQDAGATVINPPAAVRATRREALLALSRPAGPLVEGALVETNDGERIPPALLSAGSAWVKRADYHALGPNDVVRVDASQVIPALRAMGARGIRRAVVQPHLQGPVVKFYGVAGEQAFFKAFPLDEGVRARSDELAQLESSAFAAASVAGLQIFGGDAVLVPARGPVIIDFNAWPSFWRCRAEAARAIADHAAAQLGQHATTRVA